MEKIKALAGAIAILVLGVILIVARPAVPDKITKKRVLLNTYVTITAFGPEKKTAPAIEDAFGAMKEVEDKLNRYDPNSEVSKINSSAPRKVKVSPLTYRALELARKYAVESGGYFDVTVGSVVSLWDFNKNKVPGRQELHSALKNVGAEKLKLLGNNTVQVEEKTVIDLGAVLKGLAVDRAQEKLNRAGVKNALITTGSSTTLTGKKPAGKDWVVGIQHPRKTEKLLGTITGSKITVSTSGDYQQFFVKNGRRYNHIINPFSGYPGGGFMSVTILSNKPAAETDILSTAVFAMGRERGLAFAEKSGLDFIAVTDKGVIIKSRGASRYISGELSY